MHLPVTIASHLTQMEALDVGAGGKECIADDDDDYQPAIYCLLAPLPLVAIFVPRSVEASSP